MVSHLCLKPSHGPQLMQNKSQRPFARPPSPLSLALPPSPAPATLASSRTLTDDSCVCILLESRVLVFWIYIYFFLISSFWPKNKQALASAWPSSWTQQGARPGCPSWALGSPLHQAAAPAAPLQATASMDVNRKDTFASATLRRRQNSPALAFWGETAD